MNKLWIKWLRQRRFGLGTVIVLAALLLAFAPTADVAAQAGQPPPPPPPDGTTYAGWLSVIHGDPQPGSGLPGRELVFLTDSQGTPLVDLAVEAEAVIHLSGHYVEVVGQPSEIQAQGVGSIAIEVQSIREASPLPDVELGVTASVLGSQPFVNLLCRFPDITGIQNPLSYFTPLFADTYPGVNHYWQTMSYGNVDLDGTTTINTWFTLPRPRSAYLIPDVPQPRPNLTLLAQDCAAAADAVVNFSSYVGINIMFNFDVDYCCAYGGNEVLFLEDVTQNYRMTWLPPWSQRYSTLAHETGHALGLPHSSGPASNPPSELDIYVSKWDVMSDSDGGLFEPAFPYPGFIPPGTIAYHIDKSGWIPPARKISIMPDNDPDTSNPIPVTLEQLRVLPGSNYVLAKVPIGGSSVNFYTVEVRTHTSYDVNIPFPGSDDAVVLIHKVNTIGHTQSNAGDALIVDIDDFGTGTSNGFVNDIGATWTVGETFTDPDNDITITIGASSGSTNTAAYSVTITNNSIPQTFPDPPSDLVFTGGTANSISIAWQDNSFNEDGFRVWRDDFGDIYFDLIADLPLDSTTYTDTSFPSLTCGRAYRYFVSVYKGVDEYTTPFWIRGDTLPCQPMLDSPANGAPVTAPPLLVWAQTNLFTSFEIRLDNNPAPTTTIATISPSFSPGGLYAYLLPSNLTMGTYYWQVRAINALSGASPWSSIRYFTLASPANAAPVRSYYRTGTPTLRWSAITWATEYEVWVDDTNTFASPRRFEVVVPANQLFASVTPALPDGVYYMRVRARRPDGTWPTTWGVTETIVIDAPS